ncbi:MAG: ABC transporter ATP-binding protein [Gemmataceae bacterium]
MERAAFARARRYLNYKPVAKWLALGSAVLTGVLYVALLMVLGLFADLMVHRGRMLTFAESTPGERADVQRFWSTLSEEQRRAALSGFTTDEILAAQLVQTQPAGRTRDEEPRWRAVIYVKLQRRVGDEAANVYRERTMQALSGDAAPPSFGVLSLVARTERPIFGRLLGSMAAWNPWMWKYGDAEWPNWYYLTGLLVVAIVVALGRALLMFLMNFQAAIATLEATTVLRRLIYHHTFRLGSLAIRALGPSEAASMFTRHVEAIHDGLFAWLTVVFREPVKFALLLAFALLVHFWLALAFLLFALLVWLVGGQLAAYFRRQETAATLRAGNHLALLQESLMMLRLVKCYLMELYNQARVERQLAQYAKTHLQRFRGSAIYTPLLVFLGLLSALVLLYVAGLSVLQGNLSVPSAIVLVTALVSLYWPLDNWLEHRRFLRRGRESAAILFQFLDRPGEVGQVVGAEPLPRMRHLLEFDNITLRESGTGRRLLQGVSLRIAAGQRVALVGPDDMAKHALVYLIPRFLDPTSGEIRIDQHNLRFVTFESLRGQCAIVLQHNLVFNDTVMKNISCGNTKYSLPQVIEAAKVAHAHHFIQKLPQGYETLIGELGHPLRLGEQFRIALARAILRDPALLIIEEPQGALLDEDTKTMLDDTYMRVLPGRTTIFLPHRLPTIRSCNLVFLLHEGKIEATGEHRELLQENELYQHLHYLEFNMFAGQF